MAIAKVVFEAYDGNGDPSMTYTNTMYYSDGLDPEIGPTTAAATELAAHVGLAYTNNIDQYFSPHVARSPLWPVVKVYDGWGTGPTGNPPFAGGSPIVENSLVLFNASTQAANTIFLPREVSAVVTLHAELANVLERVPAGPAGPAGDIKPKARRRGRLYIGPLANVCMASTGATLATGFITALQNFAVDLTEAPLGAAASGYELVVFSKTDAIARTVTGGWIDNEPDTQRRRGLDQGVKTTWVAA